MKIEKYKIPFLDVLISKKEDGSIAHQVHGKKTLTERYLHANFHHFPRKKCVISTKGRYQRTKDL